MTKTLFNIQLRISEEIIDLPVIQNDTQTTLLDRLCDYESVKKQFRKILNMKIKDSLTMILNKNNIQNQLKEKVQNFLSGDIANSQTKNKTKTKSSIENLENKYKKPQAKNESHSPINYSYSNSLKYPPIKSLPIPSIPPLNLSKDKVLMQVPEVRKSHIMSSNQKSAGNRQIITAYETVYSKCKDPQLKNMIKKTLQELEKPQLSDLNTKSKNQKYSPSPIVSKTPYHQLSNPEEVVEPSYRPTFRYSLQQKNQNCQVLDTNIHNYQISSNKYQNTQINKSCQLPSYQLKSKNIQRIDKSPLSAYQRDIIKPQPPYERVGLHHKTMSHAQNTTSAQDHNNSKSKSRNKRYNYLSYDSMA